ncbi:pupal cuticle protein 20-like [Euwallacea similis]|uniref:pupal cuticle protein 20-like n=1 Tax=Euwallacea similis TaxID=1736056 RepID=UPI0034504398
MHKVLAVLAFVNYVSSARLDNLQYLPPQGNQGQPQGFQPPKTGPAAGGAPQGQYGAPAPSGFQPQGQASGQYPSQQYPTQRSPLADVPILRLDTENPGDGTYRYAYETGNDIAAQEEGSAQSGWNKAQGSYRFSSPEGEHFEITYTADENGYVAQGAHLPTPPPIPQEILKSLEVIRQAEASGAILEGAYQPEGDDGQYHEGHDEGQYHQPSGGYPQGPQGIKPAPQGFSNQNQGPQQPIAPNGGYRY